MTMTSNFLVQWMPGPCTEAGPDKEFSLITLDDVKDDYRYALECGRITMATYRFGAGSNTGTMHRLCKIIGAGERNALEAEMLSVVGAISGQTSGQSSGQSGGQPSRGDSDKGNEPDDEITCILKVEEVEDIEEIEPTPMNVDQSSREDNSAKYPPWEVQQEITALLSENHQIQRENELLKKKLAKAVDVMDLQNILETTIVNIRQKRIAQLTPTDRQDADGNASEDVVAEQPLDNDAKEEIFDVDALISDISEDTAVLVSHVNVPSTSSVSGTSSRPTTSRQTPPMSTTHQQQSRPSQPVNTTFQQQQRPPPVQQQQPRVPTVQQQQQRPATMQQQQQRPAAMQQQQQRQSTVQQQQARRPSAEQQQPRPVTLQRSQQQQQARVSVQQVRQVPVQQQQQQQPQAREAPMQLHQQQQQLQQQQEQLQQQQQQQQRLMPPTSVQSQQSHQMTTFQPDNPYIVRVQSLAEPGQRPSEQILPVPPDPDQPGPSGTSNLRAFQQTSQVAHRLGAKRLQSGGKHRQIRPPHWQSNYVTGSLQQVQRVRSGQQFNPSVTDVTDIPSTSTAQQPPPGGTQQIPQQRLMHQEDYEDESDKLVELVAGTGVKLPRKQLRMAQKTKGFSQYTRNLMMLVFSMKELSVCSVTGFKARGMGSENAVARPALDQTRVHAIIAAVQERFPSVPVSRVKVLMNKKLGYMRRPRPRRLQRKMNGSLLKKHTKDE